MKTATATAIFRTDLATSAKTAPDWVELFPAGPEIVARDGRRWTANPEAVLAAFAANNGPLAIDYEHAQDIVAVEGGEAPAAGWITRLENRAGAVWGLVEWTARAAKMIAEREYRFLSPAFHHDEAGLIESLVGAGLVNRPALVMAALSRTLDNQPETIMSKAIATALGLAETSDEPAILARLTEQAATRTALCKALKIDGGADQAAILAAIAKLQEAQPAATELAAVKTSLDVATARIAELEKASADRDIDAALDQATAEGKITPATRETYRAMCAVEGGLERFKALAAKLPVIAEPTALGQKKPGTAEETGEHSPAEIAALARKYQQEQAAAGRTISISAAVAHVSKEQK